MKRGLLAGASRGKTSDPKANVKRSTRSSRLLAAAGCSLEGAPPPCDAQSATPRTTGSSVDRRKNKRGCPQRTPASASSAKSATDGLSAQDTKKSKAATATAAATAAAAAAGGASAGAGGRPSRRTTPPRHAQKAPTPSARGKKKRGPPSVAAAPPAAAVETPGKAAALGSLVSPQRRPKIMTKKAATAGRRQGKEGLEQHATTDGDGVSLADREAALLASLLSPIAGREPETETDDQMQEWRTQPSQPQDGSIGDGRGGDGDSSRCPLESMFSALEQVLPLLRRRRQATLFKQVRGAVEGMCGRTFTRQHLARILFVMPDAYKISSQTDTRPTRGGYRLRDLLIEIAPAGAGGSKRPEEEANGPGFPGGGVGDGAREGAGECGGGRGGVGGRNGGGVGGSLSAQRREVFRRLLVSARARYCKCEKDSSTNATNTDENECRCLPEASLPDTSPLPVEGSAGAQADAGGGDGSPKGAVGAATGAQAVAGDPSPHALSVRGLLSGSGLSAHGLVASGALARIGGDAEGWDAVQGVEALRERLRAKDALSALERNKSGDEKEADRRRKGNLPATADAVRSFFAHSRRITCSLDALVEALSSSSRRSLSEREARERVRMIAELVPEWCSIVAPPPASAGQANAHAHHGTHVDDGMVARPMKAKEVVRVNTRLQYREVREMIVFMAGGGAG